MNQQYFDNWADMTKKMQEPLQQMAELNARTLQNFAYPRPEEFTETKRPEELLNKQLALALENGHKALNYMQESFQIIERAMKSVIQDMSKQADEK